MIAEGVRWKQISDHSKYAYATDNDNVCFGDLNRNPRKQTERGGSFYCFESPYLNAALKGINPEHAGCWFNSSNNIFKIRYTVHISSNEAVS